MNGIVLNRVLLLVGVIAFGALLTELIKPTSDLTGIADGLQFLFASFLFAKVWGSTTKLFTEQPFRAWRLYALSTSFICAGYMGASVWAITWRATSYSPLFSDTVLRFGFRYSAICGLVCAILAPIFEGENLTPRRLGRVGVGFCCAILMVLVVIYGTRLGHVHDYAIPLDGP